MSTMNPLRRLAATATVLGITAFGAVTLATPALADQPGVSASQDVVSAPADWTVGDLMGSLHDAADMTIQSPVPDAPVTFAVGNAQLTMSGQRAQMAQTVLANAYSDLGYLVVFTKSGVLMVGLVPTGDRF